MADYPGEFNYGGLGYTNTGQTTGGNLAGTNNDSHPTQEAEAGTSSAAGDMLKQLMQQCLAYHEKQVQQRASTPPQAQAHQPSPPFVASSNTQIVHVNSNNGIQGGGEFHPASFVSQTMEIHSNSNSITQEELVVSSPSSNQKPDIEKIVEEGRSRANAILEKFQQLTRDHGVLQPPQVTSSGLIVQSAAANTGDWELQAASEYRIKRERFLESEKKRKNKFLIKNWEYVSVRNKRKLQQQLMQLEQAKEWEDQVQEQYQQVLEIRKQRLLGGNKKNNNKQLSSQAGIGTAKRKRVEQEKHREGHMPQQQQDNTAALYLSGMPTDGSVSEALLQQLFSGYGTIRKIHIYKNKKTGALKGDALIVYEVKTQEEIGPLLQIVCSQMNGAELACGSVLQVQPADSNYSDPYQKYGPSSSEQEKNQQLLSPTTDPAGMPEEKPVEEAAADDNKDEDSDLDDFFGSLE